MTQGSETRALQRDRPPTAFARILEGLLRAHEAMLAAVFVDGEGECIDYGTVLSPYDALVMGAGWLSASAKVAAACEAVGAAGLRQWFCEASQHDVVVRRVSAEHCLVVVLSAGGLTARVLLAMDAVSAALREEGELPTPVWDPAGQSLEVDVRPAQGWAFAPCRLRIGDHVLSIDGVLGRWTERGAISPEPLMCFRVRANDEELTLVFDPWLSRWHRRVR